MEYEQGTEPTQGQEAPAQETPATPPAQEAAPPPWLDQLSQNFGNQLAQLGQQFEAQVSPLREALEREPEYPDDDGYDPYYDPQPQSQDPAVLQQAIREAVQGELAPLHAERKEQAWESFMGDYPELQDEENAEPLAQAIDQLAEQAGNESLRDDPRFARVVYEMLGGQPQEGEPEGEPEQEQADSVFQQMWQDDRQNPVSALQSQLDGMVNERVNERVREAVGPLLEQERAEQFQALQEEFPEISTPEGSEQLAGLVHQAARHFGNPQLAGDPRFAKVVYLAKKGEERAAGEQPVGDGKEVALEEGSGAPGEPEPDHLFQQLWAQGQRKRLTWD